MRRSYWNTEFRPSEDVLLQVCRLLDIATHGCCSFDRWRLGEGGRVCKNRRLHSRERASQSFYERGVPDSSFTCHLFLMMKSNETHSEFGMHEKKDIVESWKVHLNVSDEKRHMRQVGNGSCSYRMFCLFGWLFSSHPDFMHIQYYSHLQTAVFVTSSSKMQRHSRIMGAWRCWTRRWRWIRIITLISS